MYFKNVFWDGSLDSVNHHLNCEVCGERLGRHNKSAECLPLHKYQSTKSEPVPKDWTEYPHSTTGLTFQPKIEGLQAIPSKPTVSGRNPALVISDELAGEFMGLDDLPGPSLHETFERTWPSTERFRNFAWLEFLQRAAPDVAAVEDTSLPPRIRRIVNEKEEAHAAKKKLAKDAQAQALQERADQLAGAGRAMDVVDQDHDQRMGWVHK